MSRRTQKNVGVIGLGIIGRRVADNLRRRGFHVFVWNRTPRPVPNFVGSPAELAELCDFIQIFVSDDEALMQMVQQMKPSLHVQHVIMAHSTVAPHTMRNAAEIVQRRGAQFLDAPFTGSKIPAEKGELVYYVAGDDAAYRRARPVLEASSKEIIEIGEIGQATTVKIATNMVTAATVQAAAEALALVHHSGLPPERFIAALRGNASNSGTLSMKLPKMIEGDFEAHFSVKHMLKDVQIAARMARSYGLTLGATEAARDSLLDEAQSGRGDQDFASLVRFFFPDGLPAELSAEAEDDDAQQTLNGVDDEAAAQRPSVERPMPAESTRELVAATRGASSPPDRSADELEEEDETVTNRGDEEPADATPPQAAPDLGDSPVAAESDVPTAASSTRMGDDDAETAASVPATALARGSESTDSEETTHAQPESATVASKIGTERVEATDERAEATDERAEATDERVEATDERAEPADERAEPADERAEPADERAEPTDERAEPTDERAEPADERAEPADERAEPADERAEPADERAERADERAAPAFARFEPIAQRSHSVVVRSDSADRTAAVAPSPITTEAPSRTQDESAGVADDAREAPRELAEASLTAEREQQPPVADEEPESEAEPASTAEPDEHRAAEPAAVASTTAETRGREPGDYDIGGEPPRERRANGDRQPAPPEPPPDREDAAARRSFLSRMFGKGGDY